MNRAHTYLSKLACLMTLACAATCALRGAPDGDSLSQCREIALPYERAEALNSLLADADATALADYFSQVQTFPPALRAEFLPPILSAWGTVDPEGALRACLAQPSLFLQRHHLRELFRAWGQSNPLEAYAAIRRFEKQPPVYYLLTSFCEGYAKRDPKAAFFFLLEKEKADPGLMDGFGTAQEAILREWALQNPQEAAGILLEFEQSGRGYSLSDFAETWFANAPEDFCRYIAKLPKEQQRLMTQGAIDIENADLSNAPLLLSLILQYCGNNTWSLRELVRAWAVKNPERTFALANGVAARSLRKALLSEIFAVWGNNDFDAASAALSGIDDASLRNELLVILWKSRLKAENFPKDFKLLYGIENPSLRKQIMAEAFRDYLKKGGDLALLNPYLSTPEQKRDLLVALVRTPGMDYYGQFTITDKKTSETLREWALMIPPSEVRMQLLGMIFRQDTPQMGDLTWMDQNLTPPECAYVLGEMLSGSEVRAKALLSVENFNALPEGVLRDRFMRLLAKNMAEASPQAAKEWLASLPPDKAKEEAYAEYVGVLVNKNQLDAALDALSAMSNDDDGGSYYKNHVWSDIIQKDPGKALTWAMAIGDSQDRQCMMSLLGWNWNKKQPEAFFAQMQALGDIPEAQRATSAFLAGWGYDDPEGAAAWAKANITQTEFARTAIMNSFGNWMNRDPLSATQWLTGIPEGAVRNQAIGAMVESNEALKSPEGVMEWALSITPGGNEANLRAQVIAELVKRVRSQDAAKAQALLENPKLTQSERDEIVKLLSSDTQ